MAHTRRPTPAAVSNGPTGSSKKVTASDTPSMASPTTHVGVAQHTTQNSVALAMPASPAPKTPAASVEVLRHDAATERRTTT